MSKRSQVSIQVQMEVSGLAAQGFGPAQILRYLQEKDPPLLDIPSKSTIERMVRKLHPPDASDEWSFTRAPEDEAQLVGDVLAYFAHLTNFRFWLTNDIAKYVVTVRRAAPDAPAPWAYALAWVMRAFEDDPEGWRAVDLMLSARPWESPERAKWVSHFMTRAESAYGPAMTAAHIMAATSVNIGIERSKDGPWGAGFFTPVAPMVHTPDSTPKPLDTDGNP